MFLLDGRESCSVVTVGKEESDPCHALILSSVVLVSWEGGEWFVCQNLHMVCSVVPISQLDAREESNLYVVLLVGKESDFLFSCSF